jgi:PAS domain S-box-containing protein
VIMNTPSTILIADDDAQARVMVMAVLAHEGHQLLEAENGAEALRCALDRLPDLVLLDVIMPEADGFEVCRRIREHPRTREIPILLITSLDDRESRVRGLSVGADGFITKPFDNAELLAQVRTITRLNRYRRLVSEQERFQRLIRLSPEGIAIIDGESRFLLANPAMAVLLDADDADELIGQSLLAYVQPVMVDRYRGGLKTIDDVAQASVRMELVLQTRRGRSIPVEISIGRFDDQNGAYAQVIVHDITERKRAEAQIQRQVSQLSSLHAIGVAITSSLQLDATLAVLLDRLIEQLRVDAASVLLYNQRSQMLELAAHRGFGSGQLEITLVRSDEGLAGNVFHTHRSVSAPDFRTRQPLSRRDQQLADAFASYFAVPLRARGEIRGVLEIMQRTILVPDEYWWVFLEALSIQAAIAIDTAAIFEQLQSTHAELKHSYDATIEGWSRALDLRDHDTEGHSERVTDLTVRLVQHMKAPIGDLEDIRRGALLHDIGKMGVPDSVLLKPGPLDADEWKIMRQHPVHAFRWLAQIPFLKTALAIPYAHHELFDGSGYPRGLRGDEIPLAARIFTVVDVWDALRSTRPYRDAWSEEQARAYLQSFAGRYFDPVVVAAFLEMMERMRKA